MLENTFAKLENILGPKGANNEPLSRCFINLVLFNCVSEERAGTCMHLAAHHSDVSLGLGILPNIELELQQIFTFQGTQHFLTSIADYRLGHKDHGVSGNFIIVKAE